MPIQRYGLAGRHLGLHGADLSAIMLGADMVFDSDPGSKKVRQRLLKPMIERHSQP